MRYKKSKSLFKRLIGAGFIFLVLICLVQCGGERKQEKTDEVLNVEIGVILPLTGEAAYVGSSVRNGMELALAQENDKYPGRKLKFSLIYEDSADRVETAVSAYTKLTTIDKVNTVVCVSSGWKAIIPLADKDEKVIFATAVSPSNVAAMSSWAFRFFISADSDATLMANFAVSHLKLSKVAILYVNDEFGNSYRDIFSKSFESKNGKIVDSEGFAQAETDFNPILTRVKSKNPEGIYILAYGNNMGLIPRQMKVLGLNIPILSIGTISQPDIMQQAGDSVEGAYYTTTRFNTFAPATPELKNFVDNYMKIYQKPPIFFEVFGYDTIKILSTVIAQYGTSAKDIRDGLLKLKNYNAAAGKVSISPEGEALFPVVVRQIKEGKYVDVVFK
jgi:branched-chain amino acid transport system substrate-binding protein